MKNLDILGVTKNTEVIVSDTMVATLGGRVIHPLLSSCALIQEMEWASRLTIIDYLDNEEDAMGTKIVLNHRKPTPVGMKIKICATIIEIEGEKINCKVEAFSDFGLIADGCVEQTVVKKNWLEAKIQKLNTLVKANKEDNHDKNDGDIQKTTK